jgi:hypothetical protein
MLGVLLGAVSTSLLATFARAAVDVPTDFAAYKEWPDNAPYDDKLEHF